MLVGRGEERKKERKCVEAPFFVKILRLPPPPASFFLAKVPLSEAERSKALSLSLSDRSRCRLWPPEPLVLRVCCARWQKGEKRKSWRLLFFFPSEILFVGSGKESYMWRFSSSFLSSPISNSTDGRSKKADRGVDNAMRLFYFSNLRDLVRTSLCTTRRLSEEKEGKKVFFFFCSSIFQSKASSSSSSLESCVKRQRRLKEPTWCPVGQKIESKVDQGILSLLRKPSKLLENETRVFFIWPSPNHGDKRISITCLLFFCPTNKNFAVIKIQCRMFISYCRLFPFPFFFIPERNAAIGLNDVHTRRSR